MANKQFDLVLLRIGYRQYAVPKAAALQFMDLCAGNDVYEWDTHWKNGGGNEEHAKLLNSESMPMVSLLGPVQFHQALENYKAYEAEKTAKEKGKA